MLKNVDKQGHNIDYNFMGNSLAQKGSIQYHATVTTLGKGHVVKKKFKKSIPNSLYYIRFRSCYIDK